MTDNLTSALWADVNEHMRKCHLSKVDPAAASEADWEKTFELLVSAIHDERKLNPTFAAEITELTDETGNTYGFADILEEYFDHLEDREEWDSVIRSADEIMGLFKWEKKLPSEYMFRKGNALEKSKRYDEAESFGKEWLEKYPYDLYAAASNVFLKVELKKYDEAEAITKKYLRDDLICDNTTDTFFMAAYRLFEITEDINAKQRVEKKMAEYSAMVNK